MNDTAWHDWRAQGIGGSDVPKILGLSSFGSAWSVWAEKVGLYTPDREYTEDQQTGLDAELLLAPSFTRKTGLHVINTQAKVAQHGHEHRRVTLDGEGAEHPEGEPLCTWQAKSDRRVGPLWVTYENVPKSMRAQCLYEMGVTGLRSCYLSVLHANGLKVEHIEIPWIESDWAYICQQVDRFWFENVLKAVPPEMDGSDATADAIAAVWGQVDIGRTEDLTDLAELVSDRADLKEQATDLEKAIKQIDNTIKARLKDAEIGTIRGLPVFTYAQQAGRRTECPECHHVTEGDPFRVLRTKKNATLKEQAA